MQRIFCNKISLQKLNKKGLHKIDNQKILKNEDIYKQLNLAITDIGLTFMEAMENLKRNTEKIGIALKETNKSSQSS